MALMWAGHGQCQGLATWVFTPQDECRFSCVCAEGTPICEGIRSEHQWLRTVSPILAHMTGTILALKSGFLAL